MTSAFRAQCEFDSGASCPTIKLNEGGHKIHHDKYGEYEILGERTVKGKKYVQIKFIDTGYVGEFRKDAVAKGQIKDKLAKTVLGVACLGNVKKIDNLKLYNIWYGMIKRCFDNTFPQYHRYGGRGVKVSDRWLVFEYFVNDFKFIRGYDDEDFSNGLLKLDKDKSGAMIYSLETCELLTVQENSRYRDIRQAKMIATEPTGKKHLVTGIDAFAKEHGLQRSHIYECMNEKREHHKGWKFRKVTENE